MSGAFLVLSTFLAAGVEGIEALTIVLATGITRGWRNAFLGMGAALVALALVIVVLGPAIALIPLNALRIVIGTLLLIFGLQWLRKAILRSAGLKAMRAEDAIYQREIEELSKAPGTDWTGFVVAFKGVFLEGLEVAFIVVTFGTSAHNLPLAALGAGLAVVAVIAAGAVLRHPLSRIPENTLKFSVGLLLTAFGTFWSGEGIGVPWPGEDLMLPAILLAYALLSWVLVISLRRYETRSVTRTSVGGQA